MMRRSFGLAVWLLLALVGPNTSAGPDTWSNFNSSLGFSFKYPSCWKLQSADADEDDKKLSDASSIEADRGVACTGAKPPEESVFGVVFVKKRFKSPKERESDFSNVLNSLKTGRFQNAGFKEQKFGPDKAIVYVEKSDGKFLRWQSLIYCRNSDYIEVSTMYIKHDSGNFALYAKKTGEGDMALPDPIETMFNSVRCPQKK